jgi:hypothetical protein
MSNHIILVCVWTNFLPPVSSELRNFFYSVFELKGPCGGGGIGDTQQYTSSSHLEWSPSVNDTGA